MRVLVKGQIKTKLALHSNILRLQKAAVAAATAAKGQAAVSILILGTGRYQLGGDASQGHFWCQQQWRHQSSESR